MLCPDATIDGTNFGYLELHSTGDAANVFFAGARIETFETCDQYTIQGDLFSKAIREGGEVPTPLEDSLGNMAVIEAILRAAS